MTSATASTFWCATLLLDGVPVPRVRLEVGADGRLARVTRDVAAAPGDLRLGAVVPGMADAHSHAFHRALRGRTHAHDSADDGDFWRWRAAMYRVAGALDPGRYQALARAVFAEMLVSGWTAVGEFHYVHHRADGSPYPTEHAMELALVAAAREVGIRLVLLDTCYLTAGIEAVGGGAGEPIGRPLAPEQRAFGDISAGAWLRRWRSLRAALGEDPDRRITLGAAVHSVRAVPAAAIREILAGLPADVPLHLHVSEQPQENADCLAAYGLTPTGLLDRLGVLDPRVSLVHATHLTDDDVALIGAAGATVVMCPTTEADLGDGIGRARDLARAGARIALGSDQNAVVDPFREMRDLEMGERLASGRRGRFAPAQVLEAATAHGYAALGLGSGRLGVGDLCDLVEVRTDTATTTGCAPDQLALVATAADVGRVVVHGAIVADRGRLVRPDDPTTSSDPATMLHDALALLDPGAHR
ncbi:formimidoylglutamate deiminase [Pengzhenrongella frigida]|uniref:Formimidoylglutamate deiminase n=1 Tax=Pengzhenrongella frigida TaxID=1259133 RepID=A0A4V1ZHS4_9MICO|nr:formimidoylglutamate deiminase [Cellulomonas sp. HLT2-17]